MRIRALVLTSVIALAVAPAPAHAAARRRIVVVLVDASLDGFIRTPALRGLLDVAAVGVLRGVPRDRGRAIAVLGAGAPRGDDAVVLARALAHEGVPFVARASAGRALGAAKIRIDVEDAVPGDLATPSLAVLDGIEMVAPARDLLQVNDVLIVLGMPTRGGTGVIVAYGPGYAGLLSGREVGAVQLADVAPSILAILQIAPPASMTGHAFRSVPHVNPLQHLRTASRSRSPVPALALVAMAAALIGWHRRRRSRGA